LGVNGKIDAAGTTGEGRKVGYEETISERKNRIYLLVSRKEKRGKRKIASQEPRNSRGMRLNAPISGGQE